VEMRSAWYATRFAAKTPTTFHGINQCGGAAARFQPGD
jgi:hypothetical protein